MSSTQISMGRRGRSHDPVPARHGDDAPELFPRARGRSNSRAFFYVARPLALDETATLDAALRLRHRVFAQELGWVPACANGCERDRYDRVARHFGVFASQSGGGGGRSALAGYARVLLPEHGLMLQREFRALVAGAGMGADIDRARAFEVSRFVVEARHRGLMDASHRGVVEHLARSIVRWALERGKTQWLSVCEVRHARALRMRGLPCVEFGQVVEYQPGVPVCAIQLDLVQAGGRLRRHRPGDYAWYLEGGERRA